MIRQLTLAELTNAFGQEDAKKMFSQGQVWANFDLLTQEVTTQAYVKKQDAIYELHTGVPPSEYQEEYL
jgi:hypothetical protein